MPAPLSNDLRRRVVDAVKEGASYKEAADRFGVGEASVSRWMRLDRETGDVQHRVMGGRRFGITDPTSLEVLERLVREKPDSLVVELKERFEQETGRKTSESAIKRTLKKLGFKRKKKELVAAERDSARLKKARSQFRAWMDKLPTPRLVFTDETGTHIGMARTHGRARPGELVVDRVPRNRGTIITLLGALRLEGLVATMTIEGGTNTDVLDLFVTRVLLPELSPGDIVVWDNLAAHHSHRIRERLVDARVGVIYLPPYSPEFNPIEMAWAKLKGLLRTARARTRTALDAAIGAAIKAISPSDAAGYIKHSGYAL